MKVLQQLHLSSGIHFNRIVTKGVAISCSQYNHQNIDHTLCTDSRGDYVFAQTAESYPSKLALFKVDAIMMWFLSSHRRRETSESVKCINGGGSAIVVILHPSTSCLDREGVEGIKYLDATCSNVVLR